MSVSAQLEPKELEGDVVTVLVLRWDILPMVYGVF